MDPIIESIYKSCDDKHTNSVSVLSLMEFIKPYMPNNLSELVELQSQLDPENTNPSVSFSTFHTAMSDWIARIKAEDVNSSLELSQSFSSQTKPINNNVVEPALEEQICCLKYQLSRATDELELVKQQLVVCEEQNEALLVELKAKSKPQQRDEPSVEQTCRTEVEEDEVRSDGIELTHLRKMLSISEKQQEMYLSQIRQLENENQTLKNRQQDLEKLKREGRRSVSEMRDCIDEKESEISTLMEIINDLKCQLEDRTDRMNFYMNEKKLLKQRTQELEALLENNTCQSFNTPKLIRQLANPITPLTTKDFDTSSPIHNTSQSSDFFSLDIVTVLRSPHKSLKDEISEVTSSPKVNNNEEEVKRLFRVVKEQENLKNGLWQSMKMLANENETLHIEKDEMIRHQKGEALKLMQQITDVENNLKHQKVMTKNLEGEVELLDVLLNRQVAELTEELRFAKSKLRKEKAKNVKKLCCDQSTETEIYIPEQTDPKRTNFARQQMKLERVLEKQERVEKQLATEKAINTKLEQKYKEKNVENTKMSEKLKICETKVREQAESINDLVSEKKSLIERVEFLENDKTVLQSEVNRVEENLCNALETINRLNEQLGSAFETISTLEAEKGVLFNKQCFFERKMKEEFMRNKQLLDSCGVHNLIMKDLQNELTEKSSEIRNLKKQVEVGNVEFLISQFNEELSSAMLNLVGNVKFDDNIVQGIVKGKGQLSNKDSLVNLENEVTTLKSNIKFVILLLQNLSENYMDLMTRARVLEEKSHLSCNEDDVSAFDEDSFVSCSSDISFIQEQFADIIAIERDSFLESLSLGDHNLRNLSRKEMEEKFTTLALLLTVDNKTARKRWICEEKKFNNLVSKFFAYLNYTIGLLNMNESSKIHRTAVCHLKLLKDVTEEMLKSAAECGVLHFEKRTATCWNFVTNYVAILSQENKQMKSQGLGKSDLTEKPTRSSSSSTVLKRIGCFFCNFVWFLIIFVFVLLFYIEKECPKDGKRTCPVQWIKSLFIERIPSDNFHL